MTSSKRSDQVWVIIVTYNGASWIEDCLRSVFNSSLEPNVVVIDNASTDNTCDLIKKNFSKVFVVENRSNAGFGAANNQGIKFGLERQAEFFFLLNQDTTVFPDTIAKLVDCLEKNGDKFGLISPVHLAAKGKALDFGLLSYLKKDLTDNQITALMDGNNVAEVTFVNAAAWMLQRETFERIGGFAPLFFHYGEDRDFVNRLHYNKIAVGVLGGSFIRHYRDNRNMDIGSWTFEKRVKYYFVGWITRASNINIAFVNAWFKGFGWCLKEVIVDLSRLRLKSLSVFVVVAWKMLGKIREIGEHRLLARSHQQLKFLK